MCLLRVDQVLTTQSVALADGGIFGMKLPSGTTPRTLLS